MLQIQCVNRFKHIRQKIMETILETAGSFVGVLNMVSWKYHDAVLERSCSPSRGSSCTQFYCNSVVRAPVMISNDATMFSTTWYVYLSWKLASAGWSPSKVLGGLESPIPWNFTLNYPPPHPLAGWFTSSLAVAQSPWGHRRHGATGH